MNPRLALWLVLVTACSAPPQVPPPATKPQPPPQPAVQHSAPAAPAPVRVFDESLLRGREFLLQLTPPEPPEARDPVIGPLSHRADVVRAVEALFRGAETGELDPALVEPRWLEYLQEWARRNKGVWTGDQVRVGASQHHNGETLVPVRLWGGEKAATGWVALSEESLLITDVQMVDAAPVVIDPEAPPQLTSSPNRR